MGQIKKMGRALIITVVGIFIGFTINAIIIGSDSIDGFVFAIGATTAIYEGIVVREEN